MEPERDFVRGLASGRTHRQRVQSRTIPTRDGDFAKTKGLSRRTLLQPLLATTFATVLGIHRPAVTAAADGDPLVTKRPAIVVSTTENIPEWPRVWLLNPAGSYHCYSVLIPLHAEPEAALNTMRSLPNVTPAPRDIVIIDHRSPHSIPTSVVLPHYARIVRLPRNLGKAGALQPVFASIDTEFVVCLDVDTQSESPDWSPMLAALDDQQLVAVTGNIRPRRK